VEGGYFDDENQLIYENLPLLDANSTSSTGDVAMDAISDPQVFPCIASGSLWKKHPVMEHTNHGEGRTMPGTTGLEAPQIMRVRGVVAGRRDVL